MGQKIRKRKYSTSSSSEDESSSDSEDHHEDTSSKALESLEKLKALLRQGQNDKQSLLQQLKKTKEESKRVLKSRQELQKQLWDTKSLNIDLRKRAEKQAEKLETKVRQLQEKLESVETKVRQLRKQLDRHEERSSCCVCMAKPRDAVLLPCRHFQFCHRCVFRMMRDDNGHYCPICRGKIEGYLQLRDD